MNDNTKALLSLTAKGHLLVEFEKGWRVTFPPTVAGVKVLVRMLEHRQLGSHRLAEPGALTQAQINDLIRLKEIGRPLGIKVDLKKFGLIRRTK